MDDRKVNTDIHLKHLISRNNHKLRNWALTPIGSIHMTKSTMKVTLHVSQIKTFNFGYFLYNEINFHAILCFR